MQRIGKGSNGRQIKREFLDALLKIIRLPSKQKIKGGLVKWAAE